MSTEDKNIPQITFHDLTVSESTGGPAGIANVNGVVFQFTSGAHENFIELLSFDDPALADQPGVRDDAEEILQRVIDHLDALAWQVAAQAVQEKQGWITEQVRDQMASGQQLIRS